MVNFSSNRPDLVDRGPQPEHSPRPKINKDQGRLLLHIALVVLGLILLFGSAAGAWQYQGRKISRLEKLNQEQQQKVQELESQLKQSDQSVSDTDSWKTYSDDQDQFSLKYPSEWKELTECDGESIGFNTAPQEDYLPVCNSDKASLVNVFSNEGDTSAQHLEESDTYSDFTVEDTSVANIKGKKVIATASDQGLRSEGTEFIIYVVVTNNRTYVATYTQEANYPDHKEVFEKIIATLKFSP
jgi:hypothetical protein